VSAGPDLAQALAGYRGWRLGDDFVLRGHTMPEPWEPGVNEAMCRYHRFGGGRRRRHRAPHESCMCGLYALCDRRDGRLLGTDAIGAIAAWGDVQVHRTGFRAQFACVTALCATEVTGPKAHARLEGAAARYGVRLVTSLDELEAEALRFGAPVDFELVAPRPAAAAPQPRRARAGLGREIEQHTWAREAGGGALELGLSRGLPARLAPGDELIAPRVGQVVEKGAELGAVVAAGGTLVLTAPASGLVIEVNDPLAAAPAAAAGGPEDDAWLVRMQPTAWPAESEDLVWGRGGILVYGAFLDQETEGVDVLADLRPELRRARPPVRTYADVLATLVAARRAAPYADADAFEAHAVDPVRRRLAADDALARHLARVDAVLELELTGPETLVVFDLRGERAEIRSGEPAPPAAGGVRLSLPAPLAAECLAGTDTLLSVVRRREATLAGSRATLSLAASALSELLAPSRAWAHRRPRGRR